MALNLESVLYMVRGVEWQNLSPHRGSCPRSSLAAQQNYRTHEHETITILKGLIKWEDTLLGVKSLFIVTDHKSLEYYETQPSLSSQQTRLWEYLSCFNFTVQHVDGVMNQVVDCLSHYYETDGPEDNHLDHEFCVCRCMT